MRLYDAAAFMSLYIPVAIYAAFSALGLEVNDQLKLAMEVPTALAAAFLGKRWWNKRSEERKA